MQQRSPQSPPRTRALRRAIHPAATLLACAIAWLTADAARAEDTYEWKRTRQLLEEADLSLAPLPQGKRIAWVRVVRDNIFVEDELWPEWFNWFHKLTKDRVVRRELLFSPGEAYDDTLVEETMRNLRSMGIFALVRIVAVETDAPDAVGVVVHTRDVWSLRLEQQVSIDRQINLLHLVLIERNLAGLNNDLAGSFTITPDTYTLSESYVARRFAGSDVRVTQSQGLILGRKDFSPGPQGSLGNLAVSEPFYRLSQRVSWSVSGGYDVRVVRLLDRDANYGQWTADDGRTANEVYDRRSGSAAALGAYRFGDEVKLTLGGGFAYWEQLARPNGETALAPDLATEFAADVLPLSRRDVGPRIYYDLFLARYRTLTNVGTFGQSENVRVGPRLYFGLYTPIEALGSSANAMVFTGLLSTTHTGSEGLFSYSIEATSRLQGSRIIDQRLLSQLRFATPAVFGVRLVSRLAVDLRARDSQQTFVSLGSDTGLRGYQARSFTGRGKSRMLANVELRTLPLKLRSLHLGGVLFYDVGSVFSNVRGAELHHAVGVGIRFLFPQFNRYPFSFDVGFPVDPDFRLTPSLITPTLNTAQSVPVTELENELDTFP